MREHTPAPNSPEPERAVVLRAERLVKTYRGLRAVSDVSFSIHAGEILGYLGPNGSGKSTTVKMLTGLLDPTSGTISYRGQPIKLDLIGYKTRLGYVPEEAQLYTFLTGWEYLELVATLREMNARRFREKAESLLHDFNLFSHRHSPMARYSKGMRQRILLIAATLHNPELLVLDEPFSGLDVTTSLIFRDVLKLLLQAGKAIFFCSPVLEVVEKVCTHLLLLRNGTVVACGTTEEIKAKGAVPALEQAFLGLTEHIDAAQSAANIVAAIHAPCR